MPNVSPNYIAGGTIRTCRFINTTDEHTVSEADANEVVCGISHQDSNIVPLSDLVSTDNHATVGQPVAAYGEGDECLLELGDTVTAGQRLKSDADGKGVPIATSGTTIQHIGAEALQSGSSGHKIKVRVQIYSERPDPS